MENDNIQKAHLNSIGFKNFRKFQEFPNLELGKINLFVGGNNAGKSTVVKAILCVLTNLNRRFGFEQTERDVISNINNFYFDVPNTHIGTFRRALNNQAKDNTITFSFGIGNLEFDFDITSKSNILENELSGNFTRYRVKDLVTNISMEFNRSNSQYSITYPTDLPVLSEDDELKEILIKTRELELKLENESEILDEEEIDQIKEDIESLQNEYDSFLHFDFSWDHQETETISFVGEIDIFINARNIFEEMVGKIVSTYRLNYQIFFEPDAKSERELMKVNQDRETIYLLKKDIESIYRNIQQVCFSDDFIIEYIPAHAVSQQPAFSASAINDYQSMVIHNFYKAHISNERIIDWMIAFKIGTDFKITNFKGEIYTFEVVNMEGNFVELSDLGMGAIQLMILFLKLETISRQPGNKVVIIEEPEQNLHPNFQALLSDVLIDYSHNNDIQFIIETHSEYLIRRTQVLVAKLNKEKSDRSIISSRFYNPFKVYYFPENDIPYDMGWQKNGKFIHSFGPGFFDESDKALYELLKLDE
ncbi:MAG: ATP-binding protein [Bacteroidales bacterium]|nr:ATP-binding protein [Bacteroidales bacterium]